MIKTFTLFPGITLRCFSDDRFKQARMTIQIVRAMNRQEAGMNALLPSVLLRGSVGAPDIRAIARRSDDLYGAAVGSCVRRVGDYQTTGLSCGFVEDRFALSGDRIMEPMVAFLKDLLLNPVLEDGIFRRDFVDSERKNLILTLESEINDKRSYAFSQTLRKMCSADSYSISRLGEKDEVEKITAESLFRHYRRILKESPIEVYYVGAGDPEAVAELIRDMFKDLERNYVNLPAQTPFHDGGGGEYTEQMEVSQGKLVMGFVTPIWAGDDRIVALKLMCQIFGSGMNSKLFVNVREKLSLCYDIGTSVYGSKGMVIVSAGIDCDKVTETRAEIMNQLTACQNGQITPEELTAAKQYLSSSMHAVYDSASAIEYYYAAEAIGANPMTPEEALAAAEKVTIEDVVAAANTVKLHTVYFLEGERK